MRLIDQGMAPKIVQTEDGATYDAMLKKTNVGVTLTHRMSFYISLKKVAINSRKT